MIENRHDDGQHRTNLTMSETPLGHMRVQLLLPCGMHLLLRRGQTGTPRDTALHLQK